MTGFRAIEGGKPAQDHADDMCRAVKVAVYQFAGKVPLSTAVGVLEIAKREILDESEMIDD